MPLNSIRKYRFRIKSEGEQSYHFIAVSNNNQVVLTGENYQAIGSCRNAMRQLIKYMRPGVAEEDE